MRLSLGSMAALCLLAGCSLTPPKPPHCQGEFRPLNAPAYQSSALSMSREDSLTLCTKGSGHAYHG